MLTFTANDLMGHSCVIHLGPPCVLCGSFPLTYSLSLVCLCVCPAVILPGSLCCSINKPKPLQFWSMGLVVCLGPVSLSSCLARCPLAFREHILASHHWLCSWEQSSAPTPVLPPELKLAVSRNTQVHPPHTHSCTLDCTSAPLPFVLDTRPLRWIRLPHHHHPPVPVSYIVWSKKALQMKSSTLRFPLRDGSGTGRPGPQSSQSSSLIHPKELVRKCHL